MREYYPLIAVFSVVGFLAILFIVANMIARRKKEQDGTDRLMKDSEIIRRILSYAKPYRKSFVVVFFLLLFSVAYDIVAPLIVGFIEETVTEDFELNTLFVSVAVYAAILLLSLVFFFQNSFLL